MEIFAVLHSLFISALDIFLVSAIFYFILKILVNTNKLTYIVIGVLAFVIVNTFASLLGLTTLSYLLSPIFSWSVVIIVILFQQEIREYLAKLGHSINNFIDKKTQSTTFVDDLVDCCFEMGSTNTGALIALKREYSFNIYTKKAIKVNADFSKYLIMSIFNKSSPMHDGAVIVENGKISYASTYFPIALDLSLDKSFGTRHRAALTVSQETDAIIIIVSEETGNVSIACNSKLYRDLEPEFCRELIIEKLKGAKNENEI